MAATKTKTTPGRHSFERSWSEWRRRRRGLRRALLSPPPQLTLSEWADRYRVLSPEDSAEPGRWSTDRAPYLREIMDTATAPGTRRMVWMAASQVSKTQGVCLNLIGYHIHQDPAPILLVQPTLDNAKSFSKQRLAPMIRDTPVLTGVVKDPRSRDSGNTILEKTFPGGHLTMVGSNSAAGLSSRPIRTVIFDEVDRYEESAGGEGSAVNLGEQRARTFWNKLIALISSPKYVGGRMDREFKRSDQRRYYVPCPHCEHRQVLRWGDPDAPYGIRWETEVVDGEKVHRFETAAYLCEACATLIPHEAKGDMVAAGEWIAENPGGAFPGFHLSALYSPWVSWAELADMFVTAKRAGPVELQTFVNLQLGEPWDPQESDLDPAQLVNLREEYLADIPGGVGVLTAAVDVQVDRLELAVRGWGVGEESWLIAHHRLIGDPATTDVWERLERLRLKAWKHESGRELRIRLLIVDAGYRSTEVYSWVKPRQGRGVLAVMGTDSRQKEPIRTTKRPNKAGIKLFTFDANAFKDILFSRLRLRRSGPGYLHFPAPTKDGGLAQDRAPDAEYFHQFGAERFELETKAGTVRRVWKKIADRRNEAVDLEAMNIVALHILGPGVRDQLRDLAEEASQKPMEKPAEEQPVQGGARPRRRSSWVHGWR